MNPSPAANLSSSSLSQAAVARGLPEWLTRLRTLMLLMETVPVLGIRYHPSMPKMPAKARAHGWSHAR